jgi:hypothetical protein
MRDYGLRSNNWKKRHISNLLGIQKVYTVGRNLKYGEVTPFLRDSRALDPVHTHSGIRLAAAPSHL